jgi:geranylgeranyl diphosphate synthase, type I
VTGDLRARVDAVLTAFLDERLREAARLDPEGRPPAEEIARLLSAGGKRMRPAFCYWGYRAAGGAGRGGPDEPIIRAAAALELLHTMAIVHDDLIDGAKERRGVPSTAAWFERRAEELGARGEPGAFGEAMAVLVGDLAAVVADHLFLESGFPPDTLARALAVYHPMREAMAIGQSVGLTRPATDAEGTDAVGRTAALKGGGYSVEGPLRIGAALADGSAVVGECLTRFGRPLGEAFQLRDDLEDGDAAPGVTPEVVNQRVAVAIAALDPALVASEALPVLCRLANEVAM